jgi:ribulose-5-phosphate 4-epimerase/fuculose-1-phosphate aldolase
MTGYMTEKDVVAINLKDSKKDKLASVEAKVHRAVYLNNPDIKAVAHAHALYATILSLKNDSIKPVDQKGSFILEKSRCFHVLKRYVPMKSPKKYRI